MAITLQIKSKGLFHRVTEFDLEEMIRRCEVEYGWTNPFGILSTNRENSDCVVLYNPKRIGRGVMLDMKKANQGEITVIVNLPATPTDIRDMVRVVKELERQMKKISVYWEEDKTSMSVASLEGKIDYFIQFSLECLHDMSKKNTNGMMVFMALRPWAIPEKKREQYENCATLFDFEQTMHDLQKEDIFTVSPQLFQINNSPDHLYARYMVIDIVPGLYPLNARNQIRIPEMLTKQKFNIDEIRVLFGVYEEKKVVGDGMFSYEKFIQLMREEGAEQIDGMWIKIPALSEERMLEIIEKIK